MFQVYFFKKILSWLILERSSYDKLYGNVLWTDEEYKWFLFSLSLSENTDESFVIIIITEFVISKINVHEKFKMLIN